MCIIFKLYTAPYKQTKKNRLLKKAPLEVRHNKGGSILSASGFLCLLHTVKLPVRMASAALLGSDRCWQTPERAPDPDLSAKNYQGGNADCKKVFATLTVRWFCVDVKLNVFFIYLTTGSDSVCNQTGARADS